MTCDQRFTHLRHGPNSAGPIALLTCTVATFLAIALIVSGCGSTTPIDSASDDTTRADAGATRPSLAGLWQLASITVDGAPVEIPTGARTDMRIDEGRISAQGGCNAASGQIDASDDGSLAMRDLGWTEMGCDFLGFETVYLPALANSNQWVVEPTGLTFVGPATRLTYTPGPAPVHLALNDTTWRFDTIYSGAGVERTASTPNLTLPNVELVISDGQASLTSRDCSAVSLAIKTVGGRDGPFEVVTATPATPPVCDTSESNMLVAFDGLVASTGFMVNESRLTFIGLDGETVGFTSDS